MNFFCCGSSSQNDITKDKQVSYLPTETAVSSKKSSEFQEIIKRVNNLPCFQKKNTLVFVLSESCSILAGTAQSFTLCGITPNKLLGFEVSTLLQKTAVQSIKQCQNAMSFHCTMNKNTPTIATVIPTSYYYVVCLSTNETAEKVFQETYRYEAAMRSVPWDMDKTVCYMLQEHIKKENVVFRKAVQHLIDLDKRKENEFFVLCQKSQLQKAFTVLAVTESSRHFYERYFSSKDYAEMLGKSIEELQTIPFTQVENGIDDPITVKREYEEVGKVGFRETATWYFSRFNHGMKLPDGTPEPEYFITKCTLEKLKLPKKEDPRKEEIEQTLVHQMVNLSFLPNYIHEEPMEKKRNNND